MKYWATENKLKKTLMAAILLSVIGAFFVYLFWVTRIARRTVLMAWVPEWPTAIGVGLLVGLCFLARKMFFSRSFNRTPKSLGESFFGGFCLGLLLSLYIYQACTYLLPGETIHYVTEYEITVPGPSYGKAGRCEAGVRIKDVNTGRWINLCTNKADLDIQRKPGMNAIWVNAYTNKIGTYIINYSFIYP